MAMEPNSDVKSPANAGEPKTATMDDLTSGEQMPEVKENAIEAVNAAKAEGERAMAGNLNPAPAGVKLKKDGTPAKKRGRKPDSEKPQSGSYLHGQKPLNSPEQIQAVSSIHAATVVSGVFERLSIALVSDDFLLSDIERAANIKAWSDTFDYYGGLSVSPPQALILDYAGIILSRATKPKTMTKIALAKAWFANKISTMKFKGWRKDAHSDSGTDVERENDVREKEGRKP